MILACLGLALLVAGLQEPAPSDEASAPPSDAAGLSALLLEKRDDASPELVRRLANLRTPEALEGLGRFYDAVGSLYMRRIALHGFALFDGVSEAEPHAMQKLTDIATLATETELRETAVEELAGCSGGRPFLAAIVSSTADDAVRERALRHHVAGAKPEDGAWYQRIFDSDETKKPARKPKEGAAPEALFTPPLKELAYEGLAAGRSVKDLVADTESKLVLVRKRALEELAARREGAAADCAERMFDDRKERPDVRLVAAGLLLEQRGSKYADKLYKEARRGEVPIELVFGIADLLVELDDPGLRSQVLRGLTQGQESEKRFHLRLAARIPDPKVDKALLQLSEDRERSVVVDALRAMGVRGNPTFVPRLEQVLSASEDPALLGAALEALIRIRGSDPEWRAELARLAAHRVAVVRNSALEALGTSRDASHLPVLLQALEHEDWATRLAAAKGIEALRVPEGVGALCQRMSREDGRMAVELAEILWRLTAQPFRMDGGQWKRWWEAEGKAFRFPTPEEFLKRQAERDQREAKQVSRSFRGVKVDSRFFGLRINSHNVAFVIDVSGSMEEPLPGTERSARPPTRLEVARKELIACMEALEAGTRFNILPFSNGVTPWQESSVECTEQTFAEAKEFVETLGAFGGTNIHGGLMRAFDDPNVDTIFFLSDGEPSVGSVVDPARIREEVQLRNAERGVVIHTISIGERFPLLDWLAKDNGGMYRTYP